MRDITNLLDMHMWILEHQYELLVNGSLQYDYFYIVTDSYLFLGYLRRPRVYGVLVEAAGFRRRAERRRVVGNAIFFRTSDTFGFSCVPLALPTK